MSQYSHLNSFCDNIVQASVYTLKHGMNFVQGLPSVVKIMQYALFSDTVLQAECDSMQKLQIVQEVPHLEECKKQQARHAEEEPQQVAHHADSLHTQCSET